MRLCCASCDLADRAPLVAQDKLRNPRARTRSRSLSGRLRRPWRKRAEPVHVGTSGMDYRCRPTCAFHRQARAAGRSRPQPRRLKLVAADAQPERRVAVGRLDLPRASPPPRSRERERTAPDFGEERPSVSGGAPTDRTDGKMSVSGCNGRFPESSQPDTAGSPPLRLPSARRRSGATKPSGTLGIGYSLLTCFTRLRRERYTILISSARLMSSLSPPDFRAKPCRFVRIRFRHRGLQRIQTGGRRDALHACGHPLDCMAAGYGRDVHDWRVRSRAACRRDRAVPRWNPQRPSHSRLASSIAARRAELVRALACRAYSSPRVLAPSP